ncbi:HpaII family restriction endonuclease [Algoriphagus sp. D3-2-R+10]|uniref:HpaII family restriction endonuclease n=1 Tax=Algoriphagus aurantiacus TaxID=3103948 RepID=UPI002B3F12C7|nr:HpaII family restriction endonuclease [Algoriphagus sp. D3-2-R+10]MEB2777477.1 HpaII family restriction endonuclease [Algoriphagus sp. D3-2-R+10]
MLTGNKGEWSELYTFFKLLSDGSLFSADENLNKTSFYVEIQSIKRNDSGLELNYKRGEGSKINIIDSNSGLTLLSFLQSEAKEIADKIVSKITNNSDLSESINEKIEEFKIHRISEKSQNKGDINILIYDPVHGISSQQKFSIKSFLGSAPTLFNANKTTNIVYIIKDDYGNPISDSDLNDVNKIDTGHKYIKRIERIIQLGYSIDFYSYEDSTFKLNLQLIDSDLPEIVAHIVLEKYINKITKITEVIEKLNGSNPMGYDLSQGHNFYEYRIVNFLIEAALGMTSKTVWSGVYDVVGGIIIVKPDKNLLCYHLIDFNKFRDYLKNSSRLDNPSGTKMNYGSVYKEDGKSFIKLNFQVKA